MKRSLLRAAALVATGLSCAAVWAQAPAAKPDPAWAKTKVNEICAACHGADGNSPTPINPSLAGQPAEYISTQLSHFQSGIRANAVMQGMSAGLTAEQMKSLGAYFSQQQPKGLAAKDPTLIKMAQSLFRGGDMAAGVPACAACHSPNGAGIPKNFPRLAGQHADYTYAQLKAFKAGERGMDKDGKDVNGRIMATIAARMTDVQMKAAADYTQGLR